MAKKASILDGFYVFSEFEKLAIGVLNASEQNTRDLVSDVLIIRYLPFIKMDCLQLAVDCNCEEFLSHSAVQRTLDKIWKGTRSYDKMVFFQRVRLILINAFLNLDSS